MQQIAIELLEDAPDIDAILVPIGGGGLHMRDSGGRPRARASNSDYRL
ncbi:MAG: hypothetical protein R3C60_11620 [Parvularculaceae bacterium]